MGIELFDYNHVTKNTKESLKKLGFPKKDGLRYKGTMTEGRYSFSVTFINGTALIEREDGLRFYIEKK